MTNIVAQPSTEAGGVNRTQTGALLALTSLFFMWGFVTVLNDIVSPHLQSIFNLNYRQASLVQVAFFFAYFIFSIPAARLINKTGYKSSIVIGLLTMGLGAFLFIPAASAASYPFFLGALMVLAAGVTILQVAANPYVAVLGPAKTASSRLNLTQAFNSLGTAIGPFIGGMFILTTTAMSSDDIQQLSANALQAYKVQQASSVKTPYLFIGLLLVALAVVIYFLRLPAIPGAQKKGQVVTGSVWKYRHLVLGVIGIFVYVGAEVSIGTFLIKYFHLHEIGNLSEREGAKLVTYYWTGAMVGRFIGSLILQKVKAGTLLGIAAFCATALVITSMLTTGHVAMASIILVGLCNSIMFPSIFTLGIADLGPLTGEGSGLLIMAIVGGAIIPYLFGTLADMPTIGLHHAFILPVLCYLYIAFYGLKGSQPKEVPSASSASIG
ncbi:MAG TPA: L-fucose:H+ symporter permease [Candidatus Acidoferrum sp.]|nr:L-fucose:H+ symporter permease [Candidatus Acidoferrum sp.]